MSMGEKEQDKDQRISKTGFIFSIFGVIPKKQYLEVVGEILSYDKKGRLRKIKSSLNIMGSLQNMAHMEPDGRVTQENPSPLDRCGDAVPWASLNLYDKDDSICKSFAKMGGGAGIAFYEDRYFGFRPYDGQVFDLITSSSNGIFFVEEDGSVDGEKLFPPYDKELLTNVNDITVIGEGIYTVSGFVNSARIGYLDMSGTPKVKPICNLKAAGWPQSFDGITAHRWSDNIGKGSNLPNGLFATFYLKTSAGSLLTAIVWTEGGVPKCVAVKDKNMQEIEYRRTYGFDRTNDDSVYNIY